MDTLANTIQNNALAGAKSHAPQAVLNSIARASAHTGVNFAYLMQQASTESGMNAAAKAKGSSASGLYQFIDSTWVNMVKKYGDKYGMGNLASHIDDSGHVDSKAVKKEILALKNDPEKSSEMAAEFASENKGFLQSHWGGKVGSTELYLAHFLGAGQAAGFLNAKDDNGMQQASVLFPKAAAANHNVFYDTKTGRAKSLDEVYAFFDKKFDGKLDALPADAQQALQTANDKANANTGGARANADAFAALGVATDGKSAQQIYSEIFTGARQRLAKTGGVEGDFFNFANSNSLLANPLDIMKLSQLALPGDKKTKSTF